VIWRPPVDIVEGLDDQWANAKHEEHACGRENARLPMATSAAPAEAVIAAIVISRRQN